MLTGEFKKGDKVTPFEVASALLTSIAQFNVKCVADDRSRFSYTGFIKHDYDGKGWDVELYKLPKAVSAMEDFNYQTPVPAQHVSTLYCLEDGDVDLALGGSDNGHEEDAFLRTKITTKGQLDSFLKTFHQNYMAHVVDQIDREYLARDFGRTKTIAGYTTETSTKPAPTP